MPERKPGETLVSNNGLLMMHSVSALDLGRCAVPREHSQSYSAHLNSDHNIGYIATVHGFVKLDRPLIRDDNFEDRLYSLASCVGRTC